MTKQRFEKAANQFSVVEENSLLKKSSTSGAETFTRLSVPFFVGKSCSNLDISSESVLEVTTTARFSTG